jgi:hypothetical protein
VLDDYKDCLILEFLLAFVMLNTISVPNYSRLW